MIVDGMEQWTAKSDAFAQRFAPSTATRRQPRGGACTATRRARLHARRRRLVPGRPLNQLIGIHTVDGTRNTMSYPPLDGLRQQLWDSEGNKQMVWHRPGDTGYGDLLQERLP